MNSSHFEGGDVSSREWREGKGRKGVAKSAGTAWAVLWREPCYGPGRLRPVVRERNSAGGRGPKQLTKAKMALAACSGEGWPLPTQMGGGPCEKSMLRWQVILTPFNSCGGCKHGRLVCAASFFRSASQAQNLQTPDRVTTNCSGKQGLKALDLCRLVCLCRLTCLCA